MSNSESRQGDLLFTDESALIAHSSEEIQRIVTAFSEASNKFGMKLNIKKAEMLYEPDRPKSKKVDITVHGSKLNYVPEFTSFGSTVSNNGIIDVEIHRRIAKAKARLALP